jgi:DNA mismatch repair protein MutS2
MMLMMNVMILISDYENIFVELGDRQSREDDLSTFSGHLAQIKRIAECANDKTLILLDEGFVGTDPAVGVAMARSTLEFFCTKNATVIITTHFSNLKTLADNDTRFCNGSMEFEPNALQPTYKLLNGIPGQSYAIELAIRMGLDNAIIQNARKYYGSEAQRMENILKELQLKNIAVKKELQEQEDLTKKLEKEFYSLQKERQEFIEHKKSLVNTYRTKLQKRLNAFENRLEIRERQFEKLKDTMQREIEAALPSAAIDSNQTIQHASPQDFDEKQHETSAHLADKYNAKPKKLTSFEDLSKLKLLKKPSTSANSQTFSLDENAEKFRAPKHLSSRSLLDEAKLSLQILKNSLRNKELVIKIK